MDSGFNQSWGEALESSLPDEAAPFVTQGTRTEMLLKSKSDNVQDWAADFRKMLEILKKEGTFYKKLRAAEEEGFCGKNGC